MGNSFKTKIIYISFVVVAWFTYGTLMIIKGSKEAKDLKTISGRLIDFEISEIKVHSNLNTYKRPILQFFIENSNDKLGLYLSSRQDYDSIIEKIKNKDKQIEITYLDSWGKVEDGINLHIYNIQYGQETIINLEKRTSTDKKVGMIFYIIGLIFGSTILIAIRQEKRKKSAAKSRS
ncbi:hypothetical protein [Marinifilum fragile]|uniref:hypothetical protein n=1 Tax=Marinifilum fragile TaxID=570161 RepID=UPI0006CFE774|nr:hypothetical protein [Marinifilum fragile]